MREDDDETDDDDDDPNLHWLCDCGNFIENGLHCPACGREPPWGCDCTACDDRASEDDDWADDYYPEGEI